MTKREAAIIGAYTSILCGDFADMHKYIEEIIDRPVWTHELASETIMDEIQDKSKVDFLKICNSLTD
jgi:hypothetical protein